MIGNDVIDLKLARWESNWRRKGFIDKLFTEKEKSLIHGSQNPEIEVWSLWSRKEAVYKIHNRNTGIRAFIPLKIECVDSEIVICQHIRYRTKTEITTESIHSVAILGDQLFSAVINLDREDIVKQGQIPFSATGSPASISHHGRFERIVGIRLQSQFCF